MDKIIAAIFGDDAVEILMPAFKPMDDTVKAELMGELCNTLADAVRDAGLTLAEDSAAAQTLAKSVCNRMAEVAPSKAEDLKDELSGLLGGIE
jgi:hypothetical protein